MLNAAKMAANIANENATFKTVNRKSPSISINSAVGRCFGKDKVPFVQKINDKVFELDEK
jgi:TldD protein